MQTLSMPVVRDRVPMLSAEELTPGRYLTADQAVTAAALECEVRTLLAARYAARKAGGRIATKRAILAAAWLGGMYRGVEQAVLNAYNVDSPSEVSYARYARVQFPAAEVQLLTDSEACGRYSVAVHE